MFMQARLEFGQITVDNFYNLCYAMEVSILMIDWRHWLSWGKFGRLIYQRKLFCDLQILNMYRFFGYREQFSVLPRKASIDVKTEESTVDTKPGGDVKKVESKSRERSGPLSKIFKKTLFSKKCGSSAKSFSIDNDPFKTQSTTAENRSATTEMPARVHFWK